MKPCPPPDPSPKRPARVTLPVGACDTHGHIFGPASRFPWNPARGYTPPDALPALLDLAGGDAGDPDARG